MFYRNQTIWKYFNDDKNHYYLFITDWLSTDQKEAFEKYTNLNFIHMKGLTPTPKKISTGKINEVSEILNSGPYSDLKYSKTIITKYLANYIFGLYDNYLINHRYIREIIDKHKPVEVIFPSYWEVQPSLLIQTLKEKSIPTLAIQAGIHPKEATEISSTDRYALFGKWDYDNFIDSNIDKQQLFILGWPLGEFYQSLNILTRNTNPEKIEIAYYLSMAGSWQYFLHFPEDLIINDLIEAARHFPHFNFSIRTHSGNNNKKFNRMISNAGVSNIQIRNSGSLVDSLLNTDYVFTQATTAGFESLTLDIPTFCLNLHTAQGISPFSRLKPKYVSNNRKDLIDILEQLEHDKENYLYEYYDSKFELLDYMFIPEVRFEKIFF
jgi:hypothetical protein